MCICLCQIYHILSVKPEFKSGGISDLPHPVFFPNRLRSKDVFMIQHKEHVVESQNLVLLLSPSLHSPTEPSQICLILQKETLELTASSVPTAVLVSKRPSRRDEVSTGFDSCPALVSERGVPLASSGHLPICIVFHERGLTSYDLVDRFNRRTDLSSMSP
jgi:hypothetical protein